MINVDDWESGKVRLTSELFEPMYLYPRSAVDVVRRNPLMCFRGMETGVRLHPEFADVLEFSTKESHEKDLR